MYHDSVRYKSFTRRAALLAGGKLAIFCLLAGRMYQLQVIQSKRYQVLADENRINLRLLPPPRGRILDRFGKPLAVNRENYRVLLVAENARDEKGARDIEGTLDTLARIIPLGPNERQRIMREVRKRRSFVPVTIRENLNWQEVAQIEVNSPDLPGVTIDVGQSREYPYAERMAHILGYVAAVSEKQRTGDPLLELPGFRIGKNGIEKIYDLRLRGKAGNSQVEVNAVGRVIRELERQEGQPGDDIRLAIDFDLQEFTVRRLENEKSAAAALVDVVTGDVLALASVPSYDPNEFAKGLSARTWRSLVRDPMAPLTNKAVSGLYSPGSTFKMVVALAAMKSGISPDHSVTCRGVTRLGNARFHCWKKYGHGTLQMVQSMQQSCDVYFYDLALRVGVNRIADMARSLGLGGSLGLDLPNERSGLIPTREWKLAEKGVAWQRGETLITGIGQGFVLATPLQLAIMTARIAGGKHAVTPRLLRPTPGGDDAVIPEFEPLGISEAALRVVREGMNSVTNTRRGTAYRARIKEPGMEMAGKTGTSQVRRISKRERDTRVLKNKERPWRERDHALFVGFAPVGNPRYAVSVIVEHGGGGSKAAAPVARDILRETQKRDPARARPDGPMASAHDGEGKG